jgi:hypothetical protein
MSVSISNLSFLVVPFPILMILGSMLTAYSARGQLMCHEDASPDANLMKTVLVLLGHLMLQQNFCKRNFRTPAWVDNVISLHGS